VSLANTSKDGQFLRLIREKKISDPEEMLQKKVNEAERDIQLVKEFRQDALIQLPSVYIGDTRDLNDIHFERQPTAIITSPPYANRYDYTRTISPLRALVRLPNILFGTLLSFCPKL